jgi:WD40 repeat protein
VIAGLTNKEIVVFDVNQQNVRRKLTGHSDTVYFVKMLRDGVTLGSASADSTIRLWNINTGALLRTLTGHSKTVTAFDQSLSNANLLVSGSSDNSIKVWNLTSFTEIRTINRPHGKNDVTMVKALPNGNNFASAGTDFNIRIWNGVAQLFTLRGHTEAIWDMELISDGTLASISYDFSLRIWNTMSGAQLQVYNPLNAKLNNIRQVSSNPIVLACVGNSPNVAFLNLQTTMLTLVAPTTNVQSSYYAVLAYNSTLIYAAAVAQLQAFNPTTLTSGSTSNLLGNINAASVYYMDKLSIY